MSDELLKLADTLVAKPYRAVHAIDAQCCIRDLAARVRELEAEIQLAHENGDHRPLRERAERAEAENERLTAAIDYAARTLRGDGVEDQGEAYDRAQRILDAALAQGEKPT